MLTWSRVVISVGFTIFLVADCARIQLLHNSPHIEIVNNGHQPDISFISNSILAALGLPSQVALHGSSFLKTKSLFHRPRAVLSIDVLDEFFQASNTNNIPSLLVNQAATSAPLLNGVVNVIRDTFPIEWPTVAVADFTEETVNQYLQSHADDIDSEVSRDFSSSSYPIKSDSADVEQRYFVAEMNLVKLFAKTFDERRDELWKAAGSPHLFELSGLRGLLKIRQKYGADSWQYRRANQLTDNILREVVSVFKRVYRDNCIVMVVSLAELTGGDKAAKDQLHKTRHLMAASDDDGGDAPVKKKVGSSGLNLGSDSDSYFPCIFNIALWVVIILLIALLAVSYSMWFMDPGHDSVIYRMTSQLKMKKDL